jgi:predicted enzyme related to lactoylglutathione lyase
MVSINIVEIPARNLEKSITFYARIFEVELEISEIDGQRMAFMPNDDPAAAALALTEGDDYRPSGEGIRLFITVDDLDAALARAVDAGAEIASEVEFVEGWGRFASFRDLDGTVIGLTEPEAG